jgi:chaperonin GroES
MNTSGIEPLDLRVLVRPDPVTEKTAGGIFLPDQVKDQEKFATVKATMIAVGINAFAEAKGNPAFCPPVPGDRVMIAKYGGVNIKGNDGADYRLLNDADVVALLREPV